MCGVQEAAVDGSSGEVGGIHLPNRSSKTAAVFIGFTVAPQREPYYANHEGTGIVALKHVLTEDKSNTSKDNQFELRSQKGETGERKKNGGNDREREDDFQKNGEQWEG